MTSPVVMVWTAGSATPIELVIGAFDYASDPKPAASVRSIKVSTMTGRKWNLDLWPSKGKLPT